MPYPYFNNFGYNFSQPQQNQPLNNGVVHVQSEEEARQYPVAPGYSVTFKDDANGLYYTKTMGINQFDAPQFKRFKLIEIEEAPAGERRDPSAGLSSKGYDYSLDTAKAQIDALALRIEVLETTIAKEKDNEHISKTKHRSNVSADES